VFILLLTLICGTQRANAQVNEKPVGALSEAVQNAGDGQFVLPKPSRLEHSVQFRCGVSSDDPTNQAFNITASYYNEGHSVVVVKFRLRLQVNDDAPLYYENPSNQSLEPGTKGEFSVSAVAEAHAPPENRFPGQAPVTLIECRIENIQLCPVSISDSANGVSQSNSNGMVGCTQRTPITQKLKLPPDKKWNCFDIDDGGIKCEILSRPSDNCVATICLGDMIWVLTSHHWFAFDGLDWTSCDANDLYANPQDVWKQCANVIRKRQSQFTPGEYIPLSKSSDPALFQEEPR
jgi:hypothetical protein